MLRSIGSGSSKTRIMYAAYLSYDQLKEYLRILEDKEMISLEERSGLYLLKPKGLRYIKVYAEIRELLVADPTIMKDSLQQAKYNF
jgi:predicted transcriptional regulator